jgi:hypothetical protein
MVAGDCSWPISHVVLHYGVLRKILGRHIRYVS